MKRVYSVLQPKQYALGQLIYKTGPDVATWIGGGGARAGGKSGGLRRIMLDRRERRPGTPGVIVRRTYKDVNENHIQKYFTEFPHLIPYWRATDNEFRLPNKSRLCFRYYENKQAVDQGFWGPEWYDVFIDQAEQFTEYELTIARSACRWPGAPMNDCKLGLFFNPGGIGTEFLRRIFHQKRYNGNENPANYSFTHMFGWDNYVWFESLGITAKEFYAIPDGVSIGQECKAGDAGDREGGYRCCRFHLFIHQTAEGQKLNALPPSLRSGHLLGSFDSFAGQYFAGVWDESKLILTAQQQVNLIQSWWARWMAHDDGFVHHAAIGWFTSGKVSPKLFQEVFGIEIPETVTVVVVYRCLVESEVEPGELVRRARAATSVEEARTLNRYFLSVDAWEKDSRGHSVAEEIGKELALPKKFQSGGKELVITFPQPEQAHNARIGGWRYLYAMMKKTADVLDGKMNPTRDNDDYEKDDAGGYSKDTPLLFVAGQCQDVIEAVPMAIRDDIHAGKHEDIIKLPTKADDVLDMLRYGCVSALRAKGTPFPVEVSEKRQEMVLAGRSLTEQAIVLKKMEYDKGRKRHSQKGHFR
jgi:hypothetical protein